MILHPQGPQWSALDDAERLPPLVLVVDDDPSLRSVLERILVAEGFRVATEGGGEDALEAVARINPDLVLLDVLMPGMGGLEVSRRLKEDPHTRLTPILLLTGLSDLHDRIHGLDAGAPTTFSPNHQRGWISWPGSGPSFGRRPSPTNWWRWRRWSSPWPGWWIRRRYPGEGGGSYRT